MRSLKIYSLILVAVLAVFFGIIYWPSIENFQEKQKLQALNSEQEVTDLQLAESYFKKGEYDHALQLISRYQNSANSPLAEDWIDLLVNVSEKTFDIPQLVLVYDHFPEALLKNEKASLLVAEQLMMDGYNEEYAFLRQEWTGKESNKESWGILDADFLLLQGQYVEGNRFLEKKLKGKEEVARLIRLSLLNAMDNPEKALQYLNDARIYDPSNIDAFLYQTKLLEKLGRDDALESALYQGIFENPDSYFMQETLADYYVRKGNYKDAIKHYEKALKNAAKDNELVEEEIFAKLYFFDKMMYGGSKNWTSYLSINATSRPLVSYLTKLKEDEFVNEKNLETLLLKDNYLEKNQAIYWLSLLNALSKKDHDVALHMLLDNPFHYESFHKNLETAFLQAINIQKTDDYLAMEQHPKTHTSLLINRLVKNEPLTVSEKALIKSEESFAVLALEANWNHAGLLLHKMEVIPEHFPEHVAMNLVQVMRKLQGDEKALTFAAKQNHDTHLNLLTQELKARVALKEGNMAFAEHIYESIADRSFEAKSYLARKAFRENDFSVAEKLTKELLEKYPNNPLLKDNLTKIQQKKSA